MNTNPNAKRILCFGDSNTRGVVPYDLQEQHGSRWPSNVRWTGITQNNLGDDFEIIEAGMSGRTAGFDWIWSTDNFNRNGYNHLFLTLKTHRPLDIVLVCLGVNELRKEMTSRGEDIYNAIKKLQHLVQKYTPNAHFVYILPPRPIADVLNQIEPGTWDDSDRKFDELRHAVLADTNLVVWDASEENEFEKNDGLHMDAANHARFGNLVAQKITELLG